MKQNIWLRLLTVLILSIAITGCTPPVDENLDGNNPDGNDTNYNPDDGTISLGGLISFKVSTAEGLITTQESGSPSQSIQRSRDGSSLPVIEFFDKESYDLRKRSRADETPISNLFSIDADGVASPAIEHDKYDIKVQYTLLSKDGNYIYIALDPGFDESGWFNWTSETEDTRQFIADTNCSIYKVSTEDNSFQCLDEGYLAFPISDNFRKVLSDSNSKPLQLDDEGNLYYLTAPFERNENCWQNSYWDEATQANVETTECNYSFNYSWNEYKVLRKVDVNGTATDITPDNTEITNFKVIPDGSLVYLYGDYTGGGLKLYSNGVTNALTDSANGWYGDIFFTTDDVGTVIYGSSDGGWGDNGIQFAQKHPVVDGAKVSKKLNTSLFTTRNNSPTPSRIMVADDGAIYGLFTEDMSYWDNATSQWVSNYSLNVYRILPYRQSPVATIKIESNNWWDIMNGLDFQISKGYIYYVENETHPQATYSPRQVIKIVKIKDGTTRTLLDETATVQGYLTWPDRYDIFNWKLIGDTIYFSGFDNTESKVVTGEIDTLAVKRDLNVSEYLSISEAASALGTSATIKDMEILKPKAPDVDTGSEPLVTRYYTDPENLYSASVDFSKYMSHDTVNENISVTTTSTDENGTEVTENVETMNIWLYKSLHMIMDTIPSTINGTTDPLKNNARYTLTLGDGIMDKYGWDFDSTGANISFNTIPDEGWYQTTTERIAGITDGIAARYLSKDGSGNWDNYALLTNQLTSTDVRVEFSFQMKGDNNRITLALKDAKKVDWDKVWSGGTQEVILDGNSVEWERVPSHYVDINDSWYFDRWVDNQSYLEKYNESNLSLPIATYIYKEEKRLDDNNYSYTQHWNNVGEYIKKYTPDGDYNATYYRVESYYEKVESGAKYRWEGGEYRNIVDYEDVLDWSNGTYNWVDSSYIDANDAPVVLDFWSLQVLPWGYDDNTTAEEERIQFTYLWSDEDVLTETSEIKWFNEYYRQVNDHTTTSDYYKWDLWTSNAVIDPDDYTDNNNSWDSMIAQATLTSWQNIEYQYSTDANGATNWNNTNVEFDYKNIWYKGVYQLLDGVMSLSLVDDQNKSIEIVNQAVNTTLQNDSGTYRVDFKLEDSRDMIIDNVKVFQLDTNGDIDVTLMNEDFSKNILESNVTKTYQYQNY